MAHFAKYTAAAVGHLSKHYERYKDENGEYVKFGNKEIDLSRTPENYNLAPEDESGQLGRMVNRLSQVKVQKRDDVKILCDWVVTLPKGDYTAAQEKSFFVETYRFLSEKYGEKNVVSAYVHKDESQPHMHFAFIPVVPDLKWNEKHPDAHREKVSAKECVTKADLDTFHTELQQRLDERLGADLFPVLNGATIEGAKNIAEVKAMSAKAAYDEQTDIYESEQYYRQAELDMYDDDIQNAREELEEARQKLSEARRTLSDVERDITTLNAEKTALRGELELVEEALKEKLTEGVEKFSMSNVQERIAAERQARSRAERLNLLERFVQLPAIKPLWEQFLQLIRGNSKDKERHTDLSR